MSEMLREAAAAILQHRYPDAMAQSMAENGRIIIIVPPDIWDECLA